MFVSIPFLVFGAAVLLLIGALLGGSVRVGSAADHRSAAEIWDDGFERGYSACLTDKGLDEPRLIGEE